MKKNYELIKIAGTKTLDELDGYNLPKSYRANEDSIVYFVDEDAEENSSTEFCGKIMKPYITRLGYVEYVLTDKDGNKKHVQAHRMVALLYINNPLKHPHVNHKNGDKEDNRKSNLEWLSVSDNNKHAYEELGKKPWNKK